VTVVQLAANRWWTGSAESVLTLAVGLRARGHRVLLGIVPGDRFEAKAREAGFPPVSGLTLRTGSPVAMLRDWIRVRAIVRAEQVQIIHAHHSHDHWLAGLADGPVALVRTFHNLRAVRRGIPAFWLHARTAGVIAVSAEIEARCRSVGIDRDRLRRVSGATDVGRFGGTRNGERVRAELELGRAPVIGTVARLAPGRGHEALIAGFRRLLARMPEARLLLVGKGEARPSIETTVTAAGLADRVIFAGYRDRDLPDTLAAMDCFVFMAPGSDESCRAVLEAMAAGRPVVARRVGALPETIVHGETGLLLDDSRPESIAHALETVLADPERGRAMGAAGRCRVAAAFGRDRYVDDVERLYRSLAAR
jgi:glycosyltransferase involved in cell wall biosynthesis